jgi:hypothetical protein
VPFVAKKEPVDKLIYLLISMALNFVKQKSPEFSRLLLREWEKN